MNDSQTSALSSLCTQAVKLVNTILPSFLVYPLPLLIKNFAAFIVCRRPLNREAQKKKMRLHQRYMAQPRAPPLVDRRLGAQEIGDTIFISCIVFRSFFQLFFPIAASRSV